jgi:hypothetical protein
MAICHKLTVIELKINLYKQTKVSLIQISMYSQQYVMLYTYSSILALMPTKNNLTADLA